MNKQKKIKFEFKKNKFRIGIVGVGYVGIQLVMEFAKKKFLIECIVNITNYLN